MLETIVNPIVVHRHSFVVLTRASEVRDSVSDAALSVRLLPVSQTHRTGTPEITDLSRHTRIEFRTIWYCDFRRPTDVSRPNEHQPTSPFM